MSIKFPDIEGNEEIYLDVMRAICGDTKGKSMLDLGCHHAPYTPKLGFSKRTYVDIQDRPLDDKEEQNRFIQSDIFEYLKSCEEDQFDVAIASDLIEHLSASKGIELLDEMTWVSKKHIIFTPLGELDVDPETNHPDAHKSGWRPEYLKEYACIVFYDFHKQINHGAFFAWYCGDMANDFERVKNELKQHSWTRLKLN